MQSAKHDVHQDPRPPPLMPIDPSVALGGPEWQIGGVGNVGGADGADGAAQAGGGFGDMLGKAIGSARRRPGAGRRGRSRARHRPGIRPDRRRHGGRARPALDAARLADPHARSSRRPRTSSTPRSDLTLTDPSCRPSSNPSCASRRAPRPSSAVAAVAILAIAFFMLQDRLGAVLRDAGRRARRPPRPARCTAALDEAGIAYELAEQRHRARGREGAGRQGAHRARRPGPRGQRRRRLAGGLRALRQAEARRLRLPAAGHLPARAGGRDRPHDRTASRASPAPRSSSCCPRTTCSPTTATPATAAVLLSNPADALEPGAVRGIAQLVASSRQGPEGRERHDHRQHRHAALAERRQRRRRRRRLHQAGRRGALRPPLEAS